MYSIDCGIDVKASSGDDYGEWPRIPLRCIRATCSVKHGLVNRKKYCRRFAFDHDENGGVISIQSGGGAKEKNDDD